MENLQYFGTQILPLIIVALAGPMALLVGVLSQRWTGLGSLMRDKQWELRNVIGQAIDFAEQMSVKNKSLKGDDKMTRAIDFAISEMKERKIPEMAAERLEKLIESELGARNSFSRGTQLE